MTGDLKQFGGIATGLARSPLGIIALFIVLVYGFASLVLVIPNTLVKEDQHVLVWFLVLFPILVLAVFTFLVAWKQEKLIWPSDFKDEKNYIDYTKGNVQAAAALREARARKGGAPPADMGTFVAAVTAATASPAADPATRGTAPGPRARLLWVDDHPGNNHFERRAFEAVGIEVVPVASTEEALATLPGTGFDAIVSDLVRGADRDAGLDLLRHLRAQKVGLPFFVYAGSQVSKVEAKVRELGGDGCTADPQELFEMVTRRVLNAA